MRKRYLVCAALLAACVAVVVMVLMLLPARPGVTKANVDRLSEGMTLDEVNEILGRWQAIIVAHPDAPEGNSVTRVWTAQDGSAAVIHFNDDAVGGVTWYGSDESILDRICRWLSINNNLAPQASLCLPAPAPMPAPPAPTPPAPAAPAPQVPDTK